MTVPFSLLPAATTTGLADTDLTAISQYAASAPATRKLTLGQLRQQVGLQVINVMAAPYNAVGDGVADDTTAIQAAINAAATQNVPVFFPSATYKITASLTVSTNGVHLRAELGAIIKGYGAITMLLLGNGAAGTGGNTYAGIYGGSITNLELRAGDATVVRGLYGRGAREYAFYNVNVTGFAYPASGMTVAGIEMRECWIQRWYGGRVEYCAGYGTWYNAVDHVSNDIQFFGFWNSHNGGIGLNDGGGYGRDYHIYGEDNLGGGVLLTGVVGFTLSGGYFESNVGFDVKTDACAGGAISGNYLATGIENNHKSVWVTNISREIRVGENSHYFAGAFTNGVGVYLEAGLIDTTVTPGRVAIVATATCAYLGGPGAPPDTDAQSVVARSGTNKAIHTLLQQDSTGTGVNSGQVYASLSANAAARNWAITQDNTAFGDFAIIQSTAKGGNPLTAGTLRSRFNAAGQQTWTSKIYPGTDGNVEQSAAGLYAGTGVPSNANGANGDFYLRSDGGASTSVYMKRVGAWVGIV